MCDCAWRAFNLADAHGPIAAGTILPPSRLDWAIAGTSFSSVVPSGDGDSTQEIRHSRWVHWIDSRIANCDGVEDEGDMFEQSDQALTLETGRMVNPATGVATDYEEMWRSEPIEMVPSLNGERDVTCVALRMETVGGATKRGLVVRLGQYCQSFARDGDDITVERLKWDGQRWTQQVRIGEQEFPTDIATYLAHETMIDDKVGVGGAVWKVVERV